MSHDAFSVLNFVFDLNFNSFFYQDDNHKLHLKNSSDK